MTTPIDTIAPAIDALLLSNGISHDDLIEHLQTRPPSQQHTDQDTSGVADAQAPDRVDHVVERARRALPPGSVKTYGTYWRVLAEGIRLPASWSWPRIETFVDDLAAVDAEQHLGLALPELATCVRDARGRLIVFDGHGDRPLSKVTHFDLQELLRWVGANARAKARAQDRARDAAGRPPTRKTGKSAQENFIAATRALYEAAADNQLVPSGYNPAASLKKPARSGEVTRRPLTDAELRDVWTTMATTGDDPELDALVFRLMLETASRQEGCLNLRLKDLDDHFRAVWLDQKNDRLEKFPVSARLLADLRAFAASRGARGPDDHVLRQRRRNRASDDPHPPITARRFNTIHTRVTQQHEWARLAEWSSYWLRHHAAAQVERVGGRPCKMRLLDHLPNGQTDGYGRADFQELAWVIGQVTGDPHPQARQPGWVTG